MAYLQKGERARNVECIIYPEDITDLKTDDEGNEVETAFGRIVSFVDALRVPAALSPLHDEDVYDMEGIRKWQKRYLASHAGSTLEEAKEASPRLGDKKKAHYHLMMKFQGAKGPEQLSAMMEGLVTIPTWRWEVIEHVGSSIRYLAHLDCKDKPLYQAAQVIPFGGMDISSLCRTDETSKWEADEAIMYAIREYRFIWFNQLADWASNQGSYEISASIKGRYGYWCQYLQGRSLQRNADKKKAESTKHPTSGEELIG